jgi:hypothetical protein
MRGSQGGCAVRRQEAAVRRYTPRVILTKPAQKLTPFSGKALHVLTPLQVGQLGSAYTAHGFDLARCYVLGTLATF